MTSERGKAYADEQRGPLSKRPSRVVPEIAAEIAWLPALVHLGLGISTQASNCGPGGRLGEAGPSQAAPFGDT